MCGICGCEPHPADHDHDHAHAPSEHRHVQVERRLLEVNEQRARALAQRLAKLGIEAIGLLGGAGAGKTALLEATLARLGDAAREAVVEGDCATDLDARRIAACGARVVQVTTGALCHLDAALVERALASLDLRGVERLWIENVGNLVCPAAFGCGESRRAVVVSVCEGDDKPLKYPALFASADVLVISKLDLLPHTDFVLERCIAHARSVRPGLHALALSARSGAGMDAWLAWLGEGRERPGKGAGR
jgi:hydrogenase nickel incorporation protein HypB